MRDALAGELIDKYARLGDYHWRAYRQGTIYADHARRVRRWITDRRVLDVGGGDGLIAGLLMRRGCEVLVVDPDPVAIAHARRHGVPAEVGTAYRVSGRWDAIYCGDTLEHLRRPGRAVRRFRRVAPICYVATPPRRPDRTLHDPFHHREWTPGELTVFMARAGWRQVSSEVANERILAKFERVESWWRRCLSAIFRSR